MPYPLFDTPAPETVPQVQVYTDGGCDPNPGPGGWAAILRWEGREWVLWGNDPQTTNNRMELQAAVAALALVERLLGRCRVDVYTDSQYLRRGVEEWLSRWASAGWQTRARTPVKNQDLWQLLHRLIEGLEVRWHWLAGHAGEPLNERADALAAEARRRLEQPTPVPSPGAAAEPLPQATISVKVWGPTPAGRVGWGAVVRQGGSQVQLSGAEEGGRPNALLLRATIDALRALPRPSQVTVVSDASYLIQGASRWLPAWQARAWRTKEGKPVANRPLWEALLEQVRRHRVVWQRVPAGRTDADLTLAAELAARAASGKV